MTLAVAVLIIGFIITILPLFTARIPPPIVWIGHAMFVVGLAVVVFGNRTYYLINP